MSDAPEPVARYRVWIDDACIGSGQCELIEPRRFAVGDDGVAVVIGESELTIHGDLPGRAELERQLASAAHRREQLSDRCHPCRRGGVTRRPRPAIGSMPLVPDIALGTGPIGGWPEPITEHDALATIERAWELGIRHFDTAPLYGYGQAETWLGRALAGLPRAEFTVSTKVGRLLRPPTTTNGPDFFHGTTSGLRPTWDFTAAGVRASHDESLQRLRLEHVDTLLVHDPDQHLDAALAEALPALAEMRAAGTVSAIGAGMNHAAPLVRLIAESDLDVVLAAGCCTLLDRTAHAALLTLAAERNVSVLAAGVFHQGILVDRPAPATSTGPAAALRERAAMIRDICERQGVSLTAAAVQYAIRQPGVAGVIVGARSPHEVEANVAALTTEIPEDVWRELEAVGPVSTSEATT